MKYKGFFISFEGGEGAGKSTQMRLLTQWLRSLPLPATLTLEPGGTPIGEKIRDLLLDPAHRHLSHRAELLLYEADRAQHTDEFLIPHLQRGDVVVCDRYVDSSTVYQGLCRGLGQPWVESLNRFATLGLKPDLTFVLDLPADEGLRRVRNRLKEDVALAGVRRRVKMDRLEREKEDFHRKVRQGFLRLARKEPRRIRLIDASRAVDVVAADIRNQVVKTLKRRKLWRAKWPVP